MPIEDLFGSVHARRDFRLNLGYALPHNFRSRRLLRLCGDATFAQCTATKPTMNPCQTKFRLLNLVVLPELRKHLHLLSGHETQAVAVADVGNKLCFLFAVYSLQCCV